MRQTHLVLLALLVSVQVTRGAGAQRPSTGRFLTIDSSRVYYEECGRGSAVVLLHDGLLHAVTWDAVWPALCARYHVLRYDRRGMGRSDPPKAAFIPTEDLTALLADRGITSATIVGSSSGAGLAVDYAFRHPDKVDRLVLLGPVLHGMATSQHFLDRGAKNNEPLARGDVRAAAMNWANDRYQIAAGHDAARRELLDALMSSPRNLQYEGNLELHFAVPAAARVGEIRAPTLILVGESDVPDVQAYAGAIEFGIWGAKREVVADAGHLIQLEQPEFLTRRIDSFIASTPVIALGVDRLQAFAGTYSALMYGRSGDFVVKDGRLTVHVATERDLPLFAANDSTFYAIAWGGIQFTFRRDSTGKVEGVDVLERGATRRARWMPL